MKILYVSTISNTINAFLVPHIKMLIDQEHKVDVAFNIQNPVKQEIKDMGCNIYEIEFQRNPINRHNYKAYKKIKKLIVNKGYDLVHTHTPTASAIVRLACRQTDNVTVFYTAHGFHFYKGASIINWIVYYPIEKWLSKYTDYLITINREDYDTAIRKKFKAKEIKLVQGVGINLDKFMRQTTDKKIRKRKQYGYKEDDFILFYAAELNYNKHQDLLINVIHILRKTIPNIKLLLAGKGPLENRYKKQAEDFGLEENIQFLGYRKDIDNLLALSDITVASSRREGLPVNVMEAMATGLPLVATNVRGHRDLVEDDKNGYLIDINDVVGFANSIKSLYNNEELRRRFGQKSVELVQKYSIENVLSEMAKMYETNLKRE